MRVAARSSSPPQASQEARDGSSYTRQEFLKYFGKDKGERLPGLRCIAAAISQTRGELIGQLFAARAAEVQTEFQSSSDRCPCRKVIWP